MQEIGLPNYDEGPDIDEENVTDQDNNEVEVVDEGNEVPNQSGSSRDEVLGDGNATQSSTNASVPVASSIESANQDQPLRQSSEATSSGPINNGSGSNNMASFCLCLLLLGLVKTDYNNSSNFTILQIKGRQSLGVISLVPAI